MIVAVIIISFPDLRQCLVSVLFSWYLGKVKGFSVLELRVIKTVGSRSANVSGGRL